MMKSDIDKNFSRFFQIVMSKFWDTVVFLRLHESQNKRSHIFSQRWCYTGRWFATTIFSAYTELQWWNDVVTIRKKQGRNNVFSHHLKYARSAQLGHAIWQKRRKQNKFSTDNFRPIFLSWSAHFF